MRRILITALAAALGGGVTGCGDEDPTELGSDLIGPGVRTYEVFLESDAFLRRDTTFDGLGTLSQAGVRLVAASYEGELEGHTLFSVNRPRRVTYEDDGVSRTDSVLSIVGGILTVVVDTVATTAGPITLEVHALAEEWDWRTATWTLRNDTASAPVPWTTPGGTVEAVLTSADWIGGDTLNIPLDSQTVAIWADSAAAARGGLLRSATPGSRIVLQAMSFAYDVVPESRPDTVVTAGSMGSRATLVFPDPAPPIAGELRAGGVPGWRALLEFEDLGAATIPCAPDSPPGCTVPLRDVAINFAGLRLTPLPVGSRRIERPIRLENRAVVPGPEGLPITRLPLSGLLGVTQDSIPADAFTGDPGDAAPLEVPVTNFVRRLARPPEGREAWLWMALTPANELGIFGYAAFAGLNSAWPQSLRLVVSVPHEAMP